MADEKPVEKVRTSSNLNRVHTHESVDEGAALELLGYKPELKRNRSMFTLLAQSIAIAAVPYGEGSPLISAAYGGQLCIFLGWILVLILDESIALSLGELASRYPTSGGPAYWSFQLAGPKWRTQVAYITGWVWLIGNWTITLSVNFGFASLISGTIAMYHPDFVLNDWQLLLVFYAITLFTLVICLFFNDYLPMIDMICAIWTAISIVIILLALSVEAKAGRNSAAVSLGQFNTELSGWGTFSFFIGLLPAAYTFSAIGMISSMAEECADPAIKVPRAISLCVPVAGISGLFFVIPICVTLPPLEDVIGAPAGQALPYIFARVMGTPGGGLGLIFLVLVVTIFCSISITVAASRCTWAFARDDAIPGAKLWAKVNTRLGVPVYSLLLVTVVCMLLGLIGLGSTAAFTAFVSVGVQALALSYGIPIAISLFTRRKEVDKARWHLKYGMGTAANVLALAWITFELVLFSMPTVLPTTATAMNYSSVVLVGFGTIAVVWYVVHSRKYYKGPPASEGL